MSERPPVTRVSADISKVFGGTEGVVRRRSSPIDPAETLELF
tara:strand:+ start:77 stop:202 length:126 start_codon:yes stop_codon:yes gene_type:complete